MTEPHPGPLTGSYWVRPGRLIAGPYPYPWFSSEKAFRDLKSLLAARVTYFLDLTEENEVSAYDLPLMSLAATRATKVVHQRLAIPDMDVPTRDAMITILDTLDVALMKDHTVYVHCLGGIGRTGTVIGCWLVRHGMSGQAALDELVRLRGGRRDSPQTTAQFSMVRRWEEG